MAQSNFEKLEVYKLAEKLAAETWNMVLAWDYFAKDCLGKQLARAADSIAANIAEGAGRGSYQDNRRFVMMARGSLYETQHWLRQAVKRQLMTPEQVQRIKPILDELLPRLNAFLRSISSASTANRQQLSANSTKDK
jgi:four helix bundle protein